MLIVLWDIVFVLLFKLLTWYRQVKQSIINTGTLLPLHRPPKTFEGLEQTKEISEISLILQKLTCASKACKHPQTPGETNQSLSRSHQSVSFIVVLSVFSISWLKVLHTCIHTKNVEFDNTSTVTGQTRQESL